MIDLLKLGVVVAATELTYPFWLQPLRLFVVVGSFLAGWSSANTLRKSACILGKHVVVQVILDLMAFSAQRLRFCFKGCARVWQARGLGVAQIFGVGVVSFEATLVGQPFSVDFLSFMLVIDLPLSHIGFLHLLLLLNQFPLGGRNPASWAASAGTAVEGGPHAKTGHALLAASLHCLRIHGTAISIIL